jgi:hypothetical protein
MELFLPGIATLLIIGLIVFLVLPRLGAPVLAALSVVLLVYGVYNHIQLFSSEYRFSTWQDRLKEYASFIIIGALILGILLYLGFLYATQGASALPASNVPVANAAEVVNTANDAINTVTNTVANAAAAVTNTASNAVTGVTNALGITNTNRRPNANYQNRQGVLSNLGKILTTPLTAANNAIRNIRNNRPVF